MDMYHEGLAKLGETFNAFGNAASASYEAIVTGQGSASAAFKKVMADGLLAMGKSSVIEALRETALGFGSLALGPLGGVSAGMHFKAAGLHAAVAAAAGLAANSLGTSAQAAAAANKPAASDSASTGEHSVSGGGSGSGGGKEGRPIVFVVGENFSQMSLRQRALEAERTVRKALGSDGGYNS
jgi:hypothetical protein